MKTLKSFLLLSVIVLAYSCSKDSISNLPPATQTGAKTFGCLIDGKLYKCSGYWNTDAILWPSDEGCNFYTTKDKVIIAAKTKNPDSSFAIGFSNPNRTTGTFTEGIVYHTREALPNTNSKFIITRFDNNIISGTFQFTIQDLNGKIKKFTHGRFDIKNEK